MSLSVATLWRMSTHPDPRPPGTAPSHAHDVFTPPDDDPCHGTIALADVLADVSAGLLGLLIVALGLLIACGWLTTLWGAVLLAALLFFPLLLMLTVLLRP
jgi:hypothetical protein